MKKQKKSSSYTKNIMFYHHELDFESSNGSTYWLITEVVDNVPIKTCFYKIPDNYRDDSLLGKMHQRFCSYCPN